MQIGSHGTDIAIIEDYVQNHRNLLNETPYENENKFTFLSGHRTIIMNIPTYLKDLVAKTSTSVAELCPTFQYLSAAMKSLFQTAQSNPSVIEEKNFLLSPLLFVLDILRANATVFFVKSFYLLEYFFFFCKNPFYLKLLFFFLFSFLRKLFLGP